MKQDELEILVQDYLTGKKKSTIKLYLILNVVLH